MRYLSVCSGIEAASVAWHSLGWTPVGFSEIEKFPSAVLAHRFPSVPNLGDMTRHAEWPIKPGSIDLLVGGTPCQSFSVAGLRKGLGDPRGGLMLTYLEIAQRLRPRWIVWENVPGVLSSNGGRDFGSFLGALGELGYGWAYRVLDAQWCRTHGHPRAVPQRRRRVFVVGCLGDGAAAASVLFERESVCRNNQAQRKTREEVADDARCRATGGGESLPDVVGALTAKGPEAMGTPGSSVNASGPTVMQAVAFHPTQDPITSTDGSTHCMGTGTKQGHASIAVAFNGYQRTEQDAAWPIGASDGRKVEVGIRQAVSVRRLTPRECERLQGFPDDWTMIPWRGKSAEDCPDGPRYKALGNSMACNCMAWIGERIAEIEARGASNT